MFGRDFFESSRGRIVGLLRAESLTIDELASKLGITANAVRAQIVPMERDGLVQRVATRGTTRPASVYGLTLDAEKLLSRAYIPFLTQLVRVFTNALPAEQVEQLMRDAGRALADELGIVPNPAHHMRSRVESASELLNRELGAVTRVEDGDPLQNSRRRMPTGRDHRKASRGVPCHRRTGDRSGRRSIAGVLRSRWSATLLFRDRPSAVPVN